MSRSVPDTVFGKALQGAGDFLVVAEEYKKIDSSPAELASAYFNAALCYEIAGHDADAGLWFTEAARYITSAEKASIPVSATLRLELAKRGLLW